MNFATVLTENLIVLMIVEVVDLGLLASSDRVRPYINDAEFPSCRASQPSDNASRDHRIATSNDRAPTKSKVSATGAHSDGPLLLGLAVTSLVGLAFRHSDTLTYRLRMHAPADASRRLRSARWWQPATTYLNVLRAVCQR